MLLLLRCRITDWPSIDMCEAAGCQLCKFRNHVGQLRRKSTFWTARRAHTVQCNAVDLYATKALLATITWCRPLHVLPSASSLAASCTRCTLVYSMCRRHKRLGKRLLAAAQVIQMDVRA